MRLSLSLGYQDWGSGIRAAVDAAQLAEQLDYRSIWTAEAYGADAVTPAAWLLACTENISIGTAVMQIPARTPAATAMTAVNLDAMSGGRFVLGLGASGPQVAEGWHGMPYSGPLGRTREYVDIVRKIVRREEPLTYSGSHYCIPYRGEGSTGLGKSLKLITHPRSPELPIYLAAIGPKNVELTAEIADGWFPVLVSPARIDDAFGAALASGFAKSNRTKLGRGFDIVAGVPVLVGDDLAVLRDIVRPSIALYVGGMGAKGKNFYNDLVVRYGYAEFAAKAQDLYLDGKQKEAIALVPDTLVDEIALIGSPARIRDHLAPWLESAVTTLAITNTDPSVMRMLAEMVS